MRLHGPQGSLERSRQSLNLSKSFEHNKDGPDRDLHDNASLHSHELAALISLYMFYRQLKWNLLEFRGRILF